jgi:hypothetical protein
MRLKGTALKRTHKKYAEARSRVDKNKCWMKSTNDKYRKDITDDKEKMMTHISKWIYYHEYENQSIIFRKWQAAHWWTWVG